MNKLNFFDDESNYIEIYLVEPTNNMSFDTNIDDFKFETLLENCKRYKSRSFRKKQMHALNEGLQLIIDDDKTEHVYEMHCKSLYNFSQHGLQFIALNFQKKSKPSHIFPSNQKIHDILKSQRHTFKLSANLYINFQVSTTFDGRIFKEVFFNINSSKNFEEQDTLHAIQECICAIRGHKSKERYHH